MFEAEWLISGHDKLPILYETERLALMYEHDYWFNLKGKWMVQTKIGGAMIQN